LAYAIECSQYLGPKAGQLHTAIGIDLQLFAVNEGVVNELKDLG
jgi:hypothetical protein